MHTQSDPAGSPLCFQPIHGMPASPTAWVNSNQALGRFIQGQRLEKARKTADKIRQELTALFPLIERISRATCPCIDVCCLVTKVWFDFTDLLFYHLISIPLPPGPLAEGLEDPCQYLSPHGCRLPRLIRPWGCLQYTCPAQRRYLMNHHPQDEARLDRARMRVKTLRYRLEYEFKQSVITPTDSAGSPISIP